MEKAVSRIVADLEAHQTDLDDSHHQTQTPISESTLLDLQKLVDNAFNDRDPEGMNRLYVELSSRNLSPASLVCSISSTMDSGPTHLSLLASKVYLSLLLSPNAPVFTLFTPMSFLSLLRSIRRSLKHRSPPPATDREHRGRGSHVVACRKRKGKSSRNLVRNVDFEDGGDASEENVFDVRVLFSVLERVELVLGLMHLGIMRNPEQRVSEMELFSDFVLDPAKSSQLSLEEKRGLVRVIAQWSNEAPQLLHSWTRRELLEIICAEMGKERKYSGFTKLKMIQHLLKLVSEKSKRNNGEYSPTFSPANIQNGSKRPRKDEHTVKLSGDPHCVPLDNTEKLLCRNLACRATLSPEDAFCKRCSCCICHQYDDNKDPSLWLICSSDLPGEGDSCGMSCHLTCALRHDRAGIMKDGCCTKLDGYFYCISCGKIKGLMRTWRKQLLVAKEARRVDVLCLRVFLSYQILNGTDKYKELNEIVESAMKKLRHEVGPLDQVCVKMARGIVNRLSCGAEVQKLCASAVEAFDSMHAAPSPDSIDQREHTKCKIQFEECSPTSVIIVLEYEDNLLEELLGCKLWHRKSTVQDYPEQPTYIVLRPERRFKIIDLDPSSEYFCKVSLFSSMRILGTWEAKWISTALSGSTLSIFNEHEKEESSLQAQKHSQLDSKDSRNNELVSRDHRPKIQDGINKNKNEGFNLLPPSIKDVPLTCPLSISPLMPCKMDGAEEAFGSGIKQDSNYEYSVRAIKLLELEGHIDNEFRVKFLTWFSLKATMQDRRIVSVFVDTFMDDAPSLAGQLIDAFTDKICSGLKPVSQNGFCT